MVRLRILLIGIILLAIAAAVLVILLARTDIDNYRSEIAHQLSRALGREVQLHGPLALQIGLIPSVRVENVTLANAPGRSPTDMAKIRRLWLQVDLWRLLEGQLALRDLRLGDAEILLEWSQEGRPNWPSSGSTPRDDADSGGLSFDLRNLEIENLTLRVHHVASGSRRTARLEHLFLAGEDESEQIEIAAAGELEGVRFDLSGTTGAVTDLLSGKSISQIDLKGEVFDLEVEISGTIGGGKQRGDFEVRVSASAPATAPIAQRLGLEVPELGTIQGSGKLSGKAGVVGLSEISLEAGSDTETGVKVTGEIGNVLQLRGLNLDATLRAESLRDLSPIGPVVISGRVKGSREQVEIREMRARLGNTHFTGEVQGSFAPGCRPHLTARLASPSIHLDDIGLGPRGETEVAISAPAAAPPKSEALPFNRLHVLDADLSLQADRVAGRGEFLVEEMALSLKLADGALEVDPVTLAFEGGSFTGSTRIDARTEPPKLSLDLEGKDMHLGRALAQVEERPSVTGLSDLSLNLASRGASVDALRAALSGDASLAIREGQLHVDRMGLIAQHVVRSLSASVRRSVTSTGRMVLGDADAWKKTGTDADTKPIQCFVADFAIDEGIAKARLLALDTGEIVMLGTGQIDLVQEHYDIHIKPKMKRRSVLSVTVPVRIYGPLNDPEVSPSLLGATKSTATGILRNLVPPGAEMLPFVDEGLWKQKSCADLRQELSR